MILFAAMVLIVLIALGFHVATAVGLLAISLSELFAFNPITGALGDVAWSASADFILVAVPMFIMMGQLLLRSGVAHDMYREHRVLRHVRGEFRLQRGDRRHHRHDGRPEHQGAGL